MQCPDVLSVWPLSWLRGCLQRGHVLVPRVTRVLQGTLHPARAAHGARGLRARVQRPTASGRARQGGGGAGRGDAAERSAGAGVGGGDHGPCGVLPPMGLATPGAWSFRPLCARPGATRHSAGDRHGAREPSPGPGKSPAWAPDLRATGTTDAPTTALIPGKGPEGRRGASAGAGAVRL